MSLPDYWMNETSGKLAEAVRAYLAPYATCPPGPLVELSAGQLGYLRSYFRQWMTCGAWMGDGLAELTEAIEGIRCRGDVDYWINAALEKGIDPL